MEIDGLPVRNGAKKYILHINEADIRLGKGLDPGGCAAARAAIREGYCDFARIHVSVTYMRKKEWKYWVRLETPESLQRELIALDRNGEFVEGEHILRPVRQSHREREGMRQGSSTGANRPKKETSVVSYQAVDARNQVAGKAAFC